MEGEVSLVERMMKEEGGLMMTGDIIEGLIEAEMKGVALVLL